MRPGRRKEEINNDQEERIVDRSTRRSCNQLLPIAHRSVVSDEITSRPYDTLASCSCDLCTASPIPSFVVVCARSELPIRRFQNSWLLLIIAVYPRERHNTAYAHCLRLCFPSCVLSADAPVFYALDGPSTLSQGNVYQGKK